MPSCTWPTRRRRWPSPPPGTTSCGPASPCTGWTRSAATPPTTGGAPLGGAPPARGLRPAMTVRASAALTKRVPAGVGVSYGHTYFPQKETTLVLVPVGYADGVPRAAGNTAPVLAGGAQRTIAGRVCMDQFVLDVGDAAVRPGDEVVLWGAGDRGEPTAQAWADAVDPIHYELVTRIGGRFTRRYVGSAGAV